MVKKSLILVVMLLPSCSCSSSSPHQKVIAQVNGDPILLQEFQKSLVTEIKNDPDLWNHPKGKELIRKKTLDQLIENRLLLQEARNHKIRLSRGEVQKEIERLKSGYDAWEFQEALKREGLKEAEWGRRIETDLLLAKLTGQILAQHHPSEREIETEYRKNLSRYTEPERSHCRQIVASSREKAGKILDLLKKGENFAALAEEFSESPDREKGGDLGFVSRGDLPPILDEACFRFLPGQTSGIVTSAYGFHIFRVIEKRPPKTLSLEEAVPRIEQEWREKNQKEILKEWLKTLTERAKIAIDEEALSETN